MYQHQYHPARTNPNKNKPNQGTQHSWRCDCGRLLFKGAFLVGIIEVKCPRCKRIVYLQEFDTFTTGRDSGMIIINMDGILLSVNSGFSKSLGYQEGELLGKNISELVKGISQPIIEYWLRKMQSISTEPNPYVIALFALQHKDGHEVELSFFAKEIELNGKPVILVISERNKEAFKRYEAEFRSEAGLNGELHRAWDFIINKDGQIIAANPAGVLGCLPEDSIGSNLSNYIEDGELKENFMKQVGSEFSYVGKGRMRNSIGEFVDVEVAFTPDHLSKDGDFDISVSLIKL